MSVALDLTADAVVAPRPTPETIVAVENLTVAFGRYEEAPHRALREIDFTIQKGEMVGLVGESGAGKTTLARAIMGHVPRPGVIETGRVLFEGRDLTTLPDDERRAVLGRDLSMVIPNPRSELNPVLTIGDQIGNVVRYHMHVSGKEARAAALQMLKAVRIPDPERRLDAYPHELSGGMAQRVVIAIALACSPHFVISDDATSGLDVTVQTQVLELMTDLVQRRNASALFITRDIAITAHFCSRIIILYAGEIVEMAETAVFFDRPSHPYSVMLLAAFAHSEALRQRWTASPEGVPPAPACVFAPRCVRRQQRCFEERPALRPVARGQQVRCHFPVEA